MHELKEILSTPYKFACGIELISTRGTMDESKASVIREFSRDLISHKGIDWVSITDNAGGNPMLSPTALGKPILYSGKEVVIHLTCKDFNRNGLESLAWQLSSEGFHNILAMSGDYPISGYKGSAKPVFDIDSVGLLQLLSEMNRGMGIPNRKVTGNKTVSLKETNFLLGAVTTNFKLLENEVVPQYLKLNNKIKAGADFIISQIGYDAAKSSELKAYLDINNPHIPLIGNVYKLNINIARFFAKGKIPGVVVTEELLAQCEKQARSPDKGKQFFIELAARQMAIFKGLNYKGVYFGGVDVTEELNDILIQEASYSPEDWKGFVKDTSYSRKGEYFYFQVDDKTGLSRKGVTNFPADLNFLHNESQIGSKKGPINNISSKVKFKKKVAYKLSKWVHNSFFEEGSLPYKFLKSIYEKPTTTWGIEPVLRWSEKISKSAIFGCKDCGDCALPTSGFLCPESKCSKNQRNGPCGGTRDGLCEVDDKECIWSITYDLSKIDNSETPILSHKPIIQNQALRDTSAWKNYFSGKDQYSKSIHNKKNSNNDKNKISIYDVIIPSRNLTSNQKDKDHAKHADTTL